MRVSELCALIVEDVEDDGEATFLKVRRGKGAKFRWVPVRRQLRRELLRYLSRQRPETAVPNLLALRDGRPVRVERRGGEIERLRRILGHTSYVMVMLCPPGQGRPLPRPRSPVAVF